MRETEVTVQVFDSIDIVQTRLVSMGYMPLEMFTIHDTYFSHLCPDFVDYPILMSHTLIVRRQIEKFEQAFILYKDKTFDANWKAMDEEKTKITVDSAYNACKAMLFAGMTKWCEIVNESKVYSNNEIQFVVQEIDGLGIFIEYEENDNIKELSFTEKMLTMKKHLLSLELTLGDDFLCNKAYMMLKKERYDGKKI